MDSFLIPIKTTTTAPTSKTVSNNTGAITEIVEAIEGPADALKTLQNQPSYDNIQSVFKYLEGSRACENGFNILIPSPTTTPLINVLVNITVPDYWKQLKNNERKLLIQCLKSIGGLGASIARVKSLVAEHSVKKSTNERQSCIQHIEDMLEVLTHILGQSGLSWEIWKYVNKFISNTLQRSLLWKEYISIIATGKVISISAQAEDTVKTSRDKTQEVWFSNREKYAAWIGKNIGVIIQSAGLDDDAIWKASAQFLGKTFALGHTDKIIHEMFQPILLSVDAPMERINLSVMQLASHEKRLFLKAVLSMISIHFLSGTLKPNAVSAAAGLIQSLVNGVEQMKNDIMAWFTDPISDTTPHESLGIKRAVIASLREKHADVIRTIAEHSLEHFSDTLYIKHTPIFHQEAMAQTIVLACGYLHRLQPIALTALARSRTHLNGVSNRLSASSHRARLLGMMVAIAISELVDKPENRIKFELEENELTEMEELRHLTQVDDPIGNISELKNSYLKDESRSDNLPPKLSKKPVQILSKPTGPVKQQQATEGKILRIVEISDESEEDDIISYAKPDSDPEDDDDPTLVQRNKATSPVYIRDLISALRDTENHDRHTLALSAAADLIRRKSSFGTEVKDHIEQLATLLVGLGDAFELENFQQTRQQAIIAVILAQPAYMGPWFSRTFFTGDYSITQRATILTSIGLCVRELAGIKDDNTWDMKDTTTSFPSKKLPEKLHKIYAESSAPVNVLSKNLERMMIEPMALKAADKLSGPNALKVRTFSSRLDAKKKKRTTIPNELAKTVAQNFFFPLIAGWSAQVSAYGRNTIYLSPLLLPLYIKTLALIIHAPGPSTVSLPQMTSEFWDLLLSIRSNAIEDKAILEAVLFGLLTILEINEDPRRVAQDHGKELLETQQWVQLIFERLGGGDDEDERVRMLAAGVLLRCGSIVDEYQKTLVGDMSNF